MKLYFPVPTRRRMACCCAIFCASCAVSTDLARAVKFRGSGFFADGGPILANRRVDRRAGALASNCLPDGEGVAPQPDIPVKVVYEDAFALVLEKPPRLAVHPDPELPAGHAGQRLCGLGGGTGEEHGLPAR